MYRDEVMKTTYCLSLALLLAAPLVTSTTQEEGDSYDSFSDSDEGDAEEVQEVALPSAPRPGPTVVKDIMDDNYHMFRRKRSADHVDEEENHGPLFHNFEQNKGILHQRIQDDLRIRYFLKTV